MEQVGGSASPCNRLERDARAASEGAPNVRISLATEPSGVKGSAGETEDGGIWSGSTSNAAGDTTGGGHAAVSEGSSAANDSNAPSSSSSSASEQWAGVSQTYMQIADEATSGWTTVKASRRRVRRPAENAAPASLRRATASAVAPVLKPLPALKASRASGYKAHLPEAPQCSHNTQARHWTAACSAHII